MPYHSKTAAQPGGGFYSDSTQTLLPLQLFGRETQLINLLQPLRLGRKRIFQLRKRPLADPSVQNGKHSDKRIFRTHTFLYLLIPVLFKCCAKLLIRIFCTLCFRISFEQCLKLRPVCTDSLRICTGGISMIPKIRIDGFPGKTLELLSIHNQLKMRQPSIPV